MINNFFKKSEFRKHVLTLLTGTTIAQAIPVAISPILTRIYSPEDFGLLAIYISIVTILATVITGAYDFAIVL
jgi:O-antigen/teichoic acid export membrane protein